MRVIPALPPRHLDPQAKTFWPLPCVLWQVYRMLLAASTSHYPAAPLCRTAELAATIEQGVFTASAIIPTTGLRMSQPIFLTLRVLHTVPYLVFGCRPSHFSFTNLVRSFTVARAGLHSVFLRFSLRCKTAITLAAFSSLRPHF